MRVRRAQFTLLELTIAVAVFMMVAVALFAYSSQVSDSWSRITLERNRFSELLGLDRAVDGILTNAVPFMWREIDSGLTTEVPFVYGASDSLRIAYLHKLNDGDEGAIRFVELSVDDGELRATYTSRPFISWDEVDDALKTVSVLATGVESISFQYADWSSDVSDEWESRMFWTDEWETEESERTDIPLAVKMTVVWEDGRQECWMRRTMGNSFRERYGTWSPPVDNNGE